MRDSAWLIYNGVEGYPIRGETFICLDEVDALETYMAFVEEKMFESFFWVIQDRYEDINQNWDEKAQWMSFWDTEWYVTEVPVIHGDTCCEELPKPARGKRALLGVW